MSELILNPLLSYRYFEKNDEILNIQTAAPKKKDSVCIGNFTRKSSASLVLSILKLKTKRLDVADLSQKTKDQLIKKNIIIKKKEVSKLKKFECSPKKSFYSYQVNSVYFNNDILILNNASLPTELIELFKDEDFLSFMNLDGAITWVKDPLSKVWWPYKLSEKQNRLIKSGEITKIDEQTKQLFLELKILISKDIDTEITKVVSDYKKNYQKNNSIIINQLINPHVRTSLVSYYKNLENEGFLRYGDNQSLNRYWAHNDRMNRFFQIQLAPFISEVVGRKWQPAFTYYVSYKPKASLKKHIDRSQAGLSISLLLEYGDHEGSKDDNWPFFIEKEIGSDAYHKYIIGKGNAGLFLGNQYAHYRLPIQKNHYSMSMLMHFIPEDFKGKVL